MIGFGEPRRRTDLAVLVARALLVALAVQRGQLAVGEGGRGFEHGLDGVVVEVGKGPFQKLRMANGLQREGQVADGGAEGHDTGLRKLERLLAGQPAEGS